MQQEVGRLNDLFQGGRNLDIVDAEHVHKTQRDVIEQLNTQVDYLNAQLQTYWDKDKTHTATSKTPARSASPARTPHVTKPDESRTVEALKSYD